ncbi:hypothetical protein LOTGIDRAFT_73040, partial [Lottia gigantea]
LFLTLFTGYFLLYCVRKSFSFASPYIMEEEKLEKNQLGMVVSSQMLGYTISKFLSGVVVDSSSPSKMFSLSLFLTGFTALLFTLFNSVSLFSILWFLNGLSQGPSWPSCAILLKRWFPASQFGTWWSALSSASNLAGSVGPLLITTLIYYFGWRTALCIGGVMCIVISIYIFSSISDSPSKTSNAKKSDDRTPPAKASKKLLLNILKEPVFVGVCINYLLISMIRGGCSDWGQLYLIQDKGHSLVTGFLFTSSQEMGGFIGSLSAGYFSDFLLKVRTWFLFSIIFPVFGCLFMLLYYVTAASYQIMISVIGFGLGFGLYGVISLYGVTAMESAPVGLEGTAHSIASLSANVGVVISGYPLSLMAEYYSWYAVFQLLAVV